MGSRDYHTNYPDPDKKMTISKIPIPLPTSTHPGWSVNTFFTTTTRWKHWDVYPAITWHNPHHPWNTSNRYLSETAFKSKAWGSRRQYQV